MNKKKAESGAATVNRKQEYTRPVAAVESYRVERGFASSGAFEGLSESGTSYNDSNFT